MDTQRTTAQLSQAIRPARGGATELTENVTRDAADKAADQLRDRTRPSTEEAVAPHGWPEYTGRA